MILIIGTFEIIGFWVILAGVLAIGYILGSSVEYVKTEDKKVIKVIFDVKDEEKA